MRTLEARPRPIVRATELVGTSILKEGPLILLSDARGDVFPDRRGLGLYLRDTRVLSTASLTIDGRAPTLLRPDSGGSASGTVQMTNPEPDAFAAQAADHPAALPRESVGLRRDRELRPDMVFRERLVATNYTMLPLIIRVELLLDVDGADIFEVRGYDRASRGTLEPVLVRDDVLTFRYVGLDERTLQVDVSFHPRPVALDAAARDDPGTVVASWSPTLAPGGEWAATWEVRATWGPASDEGRSVQRTPRTTAAIRAYVAQERPDTQARSGATIETDDELLNLILDRAFGDLRLLSTPGAEPGERFVAAGVPWFSTLFGRDSLITGYAALPYRPELAVDALRVLARHQSLHDDPTADAEPGKMLHELRTSEMARTGEIPFRHYYGTVDATPLWLILLSETMHWTGDGALVDELWPTAMRALEWLRDAPRDGNEFITYKTRAAQGLRNQGWKDSSDGIRDRVGTLLEPPIALAEAQAYAVDAWRRMASLAQTRGLDAFSRDLGAAAGSLMGRFDEHFWVADLDRYAMALAPGLVGDALASNMGHCLWAGAVPPHRARRVADALLSPGLFSGWGVRTYGAGQPGYNPLGYHTGSVWPHDTALAAAGLKRYGFHEEASRLAWAVLDAARRSPGFRLPELFCGFDRTEVAVPVVHPVSCAPQAWGAGSALLLMTTLLGIVPHAERGELEIIRPVLPDGLTEVVLRGLAIGSATVDVLFHRSRGTTTAEVIGRAGDVRVTVRL